MNEDEAEGRTMAWRDTRYCEGGDQFAGATGTFIFHLFDHDTKERRRRKKTAADRGGGQRQRTGATTLRSNTLYKN